MASDVFLNTDHKKKDVMIPIHAKYKEKMQKYLDTSKSEVLKNMQIELILLEGEFTVDDVMIALNHKIDVFL